MSKIINVCTEIKCPYSYKTSPSSSSGCRRYKAANAQCHLLRSHPKLQRKSTEYFLNAYPDSVNIPELKRQNDSFILGNLENREWLAAEVLFGDETLYAPYSEETFDLVAFLNRQSLTGNKIM